MKTVNRYALNDEIRAYATEAAAYPFLAPEEESALARAARDGDLAARNRLVASHLRYVIKIAAGYRGYGLPLADLVGEGNIGLVKAVERFEPERGFRLATYAMWWIKASIQEYILRSWSLVKIGTTADQKKLFFGLAKAKRKLAIDAPFLSDPDSERIAAMIGVRAADVREMDVRMTQTASLNAPVGGHEADETVERQDLLEDPDAPDAEALLADDDELGRRAALLDEALAVLKPRELQVFRDRRMSDSPRTLEDLGLEFGVSRERVRQIEARAFEKVQKHVIDAAVAAGVIDHAPLALGFH